MSKLLFLLYSAFALALSIYSYGYLDFNLTLTSHPLFLKFVAPLQQLVYFNRPLSAQIFVLIFLGLFLCYLFLLRSAPILAKFPWRAFLVLMFILWLSYPMLSYDIFNYMFHSKILWLYHQNPHTVAPLAFEGDLWLRFMRWVHTPSAYGPIFTVIESPAYLLGFGKFVPVLYLMKATMILFYIWCVALVGKISAQLKLSQSTAVFSQLLLAFNPFLWLELVVNAHNDAVMIALLLLALLTSLRHKPILGFLSLLLSIGVKYVTAAVSPLFLLANQKLKILLIPVALLLPVLVSPGRFQPWYLVWSLIPAVLIAAKWARVWVVTTTLFALAYYPVYIATGFWNLSDVHKYGIIYGPTILVFLYSAYLKKSI